MSILNENLQYYIELKLKKVPEIGERAVLSSVFTKLHHVIVNQFKQDKTRNFPVGICFPEYSLEEQSCGKIIRIFSTEKNLDSVSCNRILRTLHDYCDVSEILNASNPSGWLKVTRVFFKSVNNRLTRFCRRHNLSLEEGKEKYCPNIMEPKEPFIKLHSASTGQIMIMHIRQQLFKNEDINQNNEIFNAYGLSKGGLVPKL